MEFFLVCHWQSTGELLFEVNVFSGEIASPLYKWTPAYLHT